MSDAAAFEATYSDWRLVKGRKVVQVVLEVPLEKSALVFEVLGGMPNVAAEVWVGVARLNQKVGFDQGAVAISAEPRITPGGSDATRQLAPAPMDTQARVLPPNRYPRRAGTLSNDRQFQMFLNKKYGTALNHYAAAAKIFELCEVETFKDICPGGRPGDFFDTLESAFIAWRDGPSVGANVA